MMIPMIERYDNAQHIAHTLYRYEKVIEHLVVAANKRPRIRLSVLYLLLSIVMMLWNCSASISTLININIIFNAR